MVAPNIQASCVACPNNSQSYGHLLGPNMRPGLVPTIYMKLLADIFREFEMLHLFPYELEGKVDALYTDQQTVVAQMSINKLENKPDK